MPALLPAPPACVPISSWCTVPHPRWQQHRDRPSYASKPGQTIQVKAKSQTMVPFQIAAEGVHRDVLPAVPGYLDVNLPSLKATVTRKPEVEEIPVQVNIQYVVEFYAR